MHFRTADGADVARIAELEAICFPISEAATKAQFEKRLKYYGNHFLLMFDGDRLISFVDGFVTDNPDLTDEMYDKAEMHDENGRWQMIFGVNTHPEYRKQGCAETLIRRMIDDAKKQGRTGLVLTCKDELVAYYSKFGFVNEGVTDKSTHGNVKWNQMRLMF